MAKKTTAKSMTRSKVSESTDKPVDIVTISREVVQVFIVGTSPLICHAMSAKARETILLPAPKKNVAERAATLKHDPIQEYRDSIMVLGSAASTLIGMLPTCFKNALRGVCVDIPGATKAQIGRLTFVEGTGVPIYGTPYIYSTIVRMADINKTPDVRTRAILPEWACELSVMYATPLVTQQTVLTLLANAGILQGIGDGRPERGTSAFGQFKLVHKDDKEYLRITKTQGRTVQVKAMNEPTPYDEETNRLLAWFDQEIERRDKSSLLQRKEIA